MNKNMFQFKQKDLSCVPELDDKLWDGDCLARQRTADNFVNMISGQIGPLTIGLNGRWGEGKTFFLTRLRKSYKKAGGRAIYFNAWKDDFLDDPLLSLIFQLRQQLGALPSEGFASSTAQAVLPILKHAGAAIVKSLVKNKIGIDLESLSIEDIESRSEKMFKDYESLVQSTGELSDALLKLGEVVQAETQKPLLIIVDELDRCRPTYAIEMLERIKHLFSIENIVFVLGIDRIQMELSISSVYGGIDARGYLRRFIDLEVVLPRSPMGEFVFRQLEKSKLREAARAANDGINIDRFAEVFSIIADAEGLSLREVEHALRKFALVAFARGHICHEWVIMSAFAVALSVYHNKELYERFMKCEYEPKEIADALFPDLDITYPVNGRQGASEIMYLYKLYYKGLADSTYQSEFDAMLDAAKAGIIEDRKHLPIFATTASAEDIYYFFKGVRIWHGTGVNLKILMSDMREVMSSVVEDVEG